MRKAVSSIAFGLTLLSMLLSYAPGVLAQSPAAAASRADAVFEPLDR